MCLHIAPKKRRPTSWKKTSRMPLSVLPCRSLVCVLRHFTAAVAAEVGDRSALRTPVTATGGGQ